jgi:acyl dehydratase
MERTSHQAAEAARYFEDFEVGSVFDVGSVTLSELEIIEFGRQFDPQPYHVDPAEAREYLFGKLVASGWHISAAFMRLYVDGMLTGTAVEGSPGVDEVRWLKPVSPEEKLFGRVTISGKRPTLSRPSCGIIENKCEFVDAHGDLIMSMVLYAMFRRSNNGTTS